MLSSSLVFSGQLSRCRAVGQQQSLLATNPPSGNRHITVAQATEHFHLLTPSHNPKYAPGEMEDGILQRHPAPALVDSGQCDISDSNVEYCIAGHELRIVTVGTTIYV